MSSHLLEASRFLQNVAQRGLGVGYCGVVARLRFLQFAKVILESFGFLGPGAPFDARGFAARLKPSRYVFA